LIDQHIGHKRLLTLRVGDVEDMLDALARRPVKPLSASSLRKERGTLQRAIDFAVRRGDVPVRPRRCTGMTSTVVLSTFAAGCGWSAVARRSWKH
jgi:hypothetical protein